MLKDVPVEVRALGGPLEQQVGGVGEVVVLGGRRVHRLQHRHQPVQGGGRQTRLVRPEVLDGQSVGRR